MSKKIFNLQLFAKTIKLTKKDDYYNNEESNVKILALGGNDSIENVRYSEYGVFNGGDYVTISGGEGNDYVLNEGYNEIIINGDGGNDYIKSRGSYATISGGAGDDSIENSSSNSKISGGAGNDLITNVSGENATINGDKGNDVISLGSYAENNVIQYASGGGNDIIFGFNSDDTLQITKGNFSTLKSGDDFIVKVGKEKIILKDALRNKYNKISIKNSKGKVVTYNDWKKWNGTTGDDEFNNYSDKVTLSANSGNDEIKSYGDNVLINGDEGNDDIISLGSYATISGGAGDDSITNDTGKNVTINGGTGNDYIYDFYGVDDYIIAGDGNDTIRNTGTSTKIDCGSGDDIIWSYGQNATMNGGKGNDYIELDVEAWARKNVIQYALGDGNDTLIGFNSDDTLQITNGNFSTMTSGDDFVVKVGEGKITIKNALKDKSKKISIKNSAGKVVTYNDWKRWNGTTGNDKFNNYSDKVTLSANSGDDYIYNRGDNVLINGGSGNDTITNYSGENLTISGGKGNDEITAGIDKSIIQYASGDGNDTVWGFNSDDTLQITKGSYKVKTSGNDVIVTVGKGKIILKGAGGEKISIKDSKGKVTTKTYGSSTSALLEENNFVTADNLSDIVKNDLTPTTFEKISATKFENLTQENNFVTYSEK